MVTDFADGVVRLSIVGAAAFTDPSITDGSDGAHITLAAEGSTPRLQITLTGVTAAQLDAGDFILG